MTQTKSKLQLGPPDVVVAVNVYTPGQVHCFAARETLRIKLGAIRADHVDYAGAFRIFQHGFAHRPQTTEPLRRPPGSKL